MSPGRRPKFPQASAWETAGRSQGREVMSGREGTGRVRGREGCRGLEARQALKAGEAAAAPAFARPRAPRQGPPPATPHSPSARRPARACPGCRGSRRPPPALLLWDSALPGSPRPRSFPRRPPSPRVPPPASPPSAFTCCGTGASRPGPCRRVSAAGPQPFPAAATTLSGAARRGAGEQLCPRGETQRACGARTHCRSPSDRGKAAAQEPAARGRVGGRVGRGLAAAAMAAT